eukprot:7617458-Pyramimonas_sp.AAC.1
MFSAINRANKNQADPQERAASMRARLRDLIFRMEVAQCQIDRGGALAFEHPLHASSRGTS